MSTARGTTFSWTEKVMYTKNMLTSHKGPLIISIPTKPLMSWHGNNKETLFLVLIHNRELFWRTRSLGNSLICQCFVTNIIPSIKCSFVNDWIQDIPLVMDFKEAILS